MPDKAVERKYANSIALSPIEPALHKKDKHMKQKLINILVIVSVVAIGAGLGAPGLVKLREQGTLSGLDITVLVIGTAICTYGGVCAALSPLRT